MNKIDKFLGEVFWWLLKIGFLTVATIILLIYIYGALR